eukprot:Blabericola_migrator_1__784@NODE_1197_length_5140_cov_207_279322_g812_i0_p1_GENE_NODE_1197_length_5140_cov_207_279322_g812_i0NODE_1197_length_5140_cov_207_279322_g812_i0_p1_ORF_typecomplete_len1298_score254_24CLASP_N/PF12348_8/0_14CLASP_N/PF12348_8/1_5CLASP_N/PF12348_8/8_6e02Sec7_N/PF12783_7/0_013Npa1/PF11707_8/1_7HEAT_EZ/PF13513_6/7_6e02HEAT_EZ/PF13513_6/1_4e03HEAT_EZ/PF13513_6/1_5e04HEAT_EZ/PF13513_6/42_NODE_1197_length_5140_cov_207_279322_g812_i011375030
MQIQEALDLLSSSTAVSSEALSQATKVLQFSEDASTLKTLATIAFDASQSEARRDSSLVILRSRLLGWDATSDEALRSSVEEGLVACLVSTSDAQIQWRVASVISAILCSQEQTWPRLSSSVEMFLLGDIDSRDKFVTALQLVKAIFTDGPPKFLAVIPSQVCELLIKGLTSDESTVRALASQSILAILESYATKSSIPDACGVLLYHLLVTCCPEDVTKYDMVTLESLSNRLNTTGYINETRTQKSSLWNTDALIKLAAMINSTNSSEVPSEVRQYVAQLAVDAYCSPIVKNDAAFLQQVWTYLMAMMAAPVPSANMDLECIEDTIISWQLRRDDEEATLQGFELPDGSIDLPLIAWTQFDKLLIKLGYDDAEKLVTATAKALLEREMDGLDACCGYFAAWMLLSIFVGCKGSEISTELLVSLLAPWQNALSLRIPESTNNPLMDRLLQHAVSRVRWACLFFINEVFDQCETLPVGDEDALKTLVVFATSCTTEPAPRVKAKFILAYCQLVANLDADELPPLLDELICNILLPLTKDPGLSSFPARYNTEVFACSVCLRELALGAVASSVPKFSGALLQKHYTPFMADCRSLLEKLPSKTKDTEAEHLAEAVLDVARRLVGAVIEKNQSGDEDAVLVKSLVSQAMSDGVFLLQKILELDQYLLTAQPGASDTVVKTGIHSSAFERTMLLVAAQLMCIMEPASVLSEFRQLLQVVQRKLQSGDMIKVSDDLNMGRALNRAAMVTTDSTTTVVLQRAEGTQKTININTSLIEEQIAALSFLGSCAKKILAVLDRAEVDTIMTCVEETCRSTWMGLVKKSSIEAMGELCKGMTEIFLQRAGEIEVVQGAYDILVDSVFSESFHFYLVKLSRFVRVAMDCLASRGDNGMDSDILYCIAEMCDGLRDAYNIGNAPLTQWPTEVVERYKIQVLFAELMEPLLIRMETSVKTAMSVAIEDDEDDVINSAALASKGGDDDLFGIRCDAAMQVLSRLFKVFPNWVSEPFDKHLRICYGSILAMEDVSVTARTAALCVFANYVEASQKDADQVLPVACLYCRTSEIPAVASQLLRRLNLGVRPSAKSAEDQEDENYLKPIAEELHSALGAGMSVDDFITSYESTLQGEVMRIQAACYCVGMCCLHGGSDFLQHLPTIDEVFASLLEHPLAGLGCRRVILDCMSCAAMKIFTRLDPAQVSNSQLKVFSWPGLLKLLKFCFPLWADSEDACVTHDILLSWVEKGALGALPPITGAEVVGDATLTAIKQEIIRTLQSLQNEEDAALTLSFQAKHVTKSLNKAIVILMST